MTQKNDPNFEEKTDMRNLVNFNVSSGKSENFYFDRLFLQKLRNA